MNLDAVAALWIRSLLVAADHDVEPLPTLNELAPTTTTDHAVRSARCAAWI